MKHCPSRRRFLLSAVAALVALIGLHAAQAGPSTRPATTQPAPQHILFVGNSYTFHNGGQQVLLRALAEARGRKVETAASVSGGKTLQWHWETGTARTAITDGHWDVVILQDHSRGAIDAPQRLFDYARKFDALIRQSGARTVFFMTWARQHQPENTKVIADAYESIARELGAGVAPVGLAWQRALHDRPDLVLHAPDKSHPTPAGSYLAACVFYATLFGDSPVGLPAKVSSPQGKVLVDLPQADAEFLQRVAEETVRDEGRADAVNPSRE